MSTELSGSAYAERRAECEAAEQVVGRLRDASPVDVEAIEDPVLRRRARHVTTENRRVDALASALAKDQLAYAGELLVASHASLRDDFEVSTPVLDQIVGTVRGVPGVYGARVTGAGFGGCVVVLCRPKTRINGPVVWRGRPAPGATLRPSDSPIWRLSRRMCDVRDAKSGPVSRQPGAWRRAGQGRRVRLPHQNRSWPSTSATGATSSSSGTWRSRTGTAR